MPDMTPNQSRRLRNLLNKASDGLADDMLRAAGVPVRDGAAGPMTPAQRRRAMQSVDDHLSEVYGGRRGSFSPLERLIADETTASWARTLAEEGRRLEAELGRRIADAVAAGNDDAALILRMSRASIPQRLEMARRFDTARTWIDPNGHKLSDRVWNARRDIRLAIDRELRLGIARGTDSLKVAKAIAQYLDPAAALRRTATPGRGGKGSYAARRLARTEITRALGDATIQAAIANPMVIGIKWSLSGSHPKVDICDEYAGRDGHGLGSGVYRKDDVPSYPPHPHCLCTLSPYVNPDRSAVIADIRRRYGLDVAA